MAGPKRIRLSAPLHHDVLKAAKASNKHRPFPFLKLPAELRNKIYELLLEPHHRTDHASNDISNYVDIVVLGNSSLLRKQPYRDWLFTNHHLDVTQSHCLFSAGPAIRARLDQVHEGKSKFSERLKIWIHSSLQHTAILRLCKQVHAEARDVLYSRTTFAVIATLARGGVIHTLRPFHEYIPGGIDLSRIRLFRIELLLLLKLHTNVSLYLRGIDRVLQSFGSMRDLRTLQIIITYMPGGMLNSSTADLRELLRRIKRHIPAHVQEVTWGMTAKEQEMGDIGGHYAVDSAMLREIVGTEE